MKKIFLSFCFFIIAYVVGAQNTTLLSFEKKRVAADKTGMTVLGSWAAANMLVSTIALNSSNREAHYFNEMNIIWNGFNLSLATIGYLHARKSSFTNSNLTDVLKHQNKTEKTFLFNAGLDVAYVTGGALLKERSRRKTDPSRLTGYGNAVMVNGSFLFLFDLAMYLVHRQHGKQLNNFTNKLQVTGTGAEAAIIYTF
ncbi:DUF6992 family protein [Ferruginibacter sp. SUN106]|uniref:DUF6992 family protein n=1 Tax=Ferruginibacter sp. SUN106 TaxID=2978348 RepID=UPI003D362830